MGGKRKHWEMLAEGVMIPLQPRGVIKEQPRAAASDRKPPVTSVVVRYGKHAQDTHDVDSFESYHAALAAASARQLSESKSKDRCNLVILRPSYNDALMRVTRTAAANKRRRAYKPKTNETENEEKCEEKNKDEEKGDDEGGGRTKDDNEDEEGEEGEEAGEGDEDEDEGEEWWCRLDWADVPTVSSKVWYMRRNRVVSRVGETRLSLENFLTKSTDASFRTKNRLDFRRSNLNVTPTRLPTEKVDSNNNDDFSNGDDKVDSKEDKKDPVEKKKASEVLVAVPEWIAGIRFTWLADKPGLVRLGGPIGQSRDWWAKVKTWCAETGADGPLVRRRTIAKWLSEHTSDFSCKKNGSNEDGFRWEEMGADKLGEDWNRLSWNAKASNARKQRERDRNRISRHVLVVARREIRSRQNGQKIIWQMMHEPLLLAHAAGKPSFATMWKDESLLRRFWMSWLAFKNKHEYNDTSLMRLIGRFTLIYYQPSSFSPGTAADLIDAPWWHDPKPAVRVLDFCSGFGGRLLGFLASEKGHTYVGVDPNTALVAGYKRIIDFAQSQPEQKNLKKRAVMVCAGSETDECQRQIDAKMGPKWQCDLVLTSPPYHDTETYCTEPTQSAACFPDLLEWRDKFLFPATSRAVARLAPDGVALINIKQMRAWTAAKVNILSDLAKHLLKRFATLKQETSVELLLSTRHAGTPATAPKNHETVLVFRNHAK